MFSSITKCTNEMFKGFVLDLVNITDFPHNLEQVSNQCVTHNYKASSRKSHGDAKQKRQDYWNSSSWNHEWHFSDCPNSCYDISVWTKVVKQPSVIITEIEILRKLKCSR